MVHKLEKINDDIGKGKLEIYDFNLNEKIKIEPYILYSIKPIYTDKGKDVESLGSYFQRVSVIHCLPLSKIITLLYRPESTLDKRVFRTVNGLGALTINVLEFLETSSGVANLNKLTLLKFRNILSANNLLKSSKAWCPLCYEEMKDSSMPIYEKLIWTIKNYNYCSEHSNYLASYCPYCSQKQNIVISRGEPGFCNSCGEWLGSKEKTSSEVNNEESIFEAKEIEDLLNYYHFSEEISREGIALTISSIRAEVKKKYWKRLTDFYDEVGIKMHILNSITHGNETSLEHLLEISKKLNISLVKMFSNSTNTQLGSFLLPGNGNESQDEYFRIKRYIESIINSEEKVSLTMISRIVRVEETTLKTLFPELTAKLIKKNNSIKRRKFKFDTTAKNKYSNDINKILEIALKTETNTPLRDIADDLNIPIETMRKKYRTFTKQITEKNLSIKKEIHINEEKNISLLWSYLKEGNIQNENIIKSVIAKIKDQIQYSYLLEQIKDMDEIHNNNNNGHGIHKESKQIKLQKVHLFLKETLINNSKSPPSVAKVAKDLNVSSTYLVRHFPDLINKIRENYWKALQQNRELEKKEREDRLIEVIRSLNEQGLYPSIATIRKEYSKFNPYDRILMEIWRETLGELGIEIQISR
ncbi:TniQ family protein [Cytobacillus kochii]|uniref:TniQ family protein n=1 Tax=Cytobacillus kochii TaxID=859143 RepID=UPI00278641E1|nr:TniQ family protein [Cytobacillus kochii]MDQ0186941.1 AraC-like DNA-binding protein [Cytobacillus kochii]